MKRFIGFRPAPPPEYYEQGAANAPDEPQYEGVVFSDGTVAVRWLTKYASHSIWPDYQTFYEIHGHPEYGTIIQWLDDAPTHDGEPLFSMRHPQMYSFPKRVWLWVRFNILRVGLSEEAIETAPAKEKQND